MTKLNKYSGLLVSAAIVAAAATSPVFAQDKPANMAHAHMGHVLTGWKDTPEKKGLLPTALAEAEIAKQHIGFALKQPQNLEWMKSHTGHVLHAVDPTVEPKGPGMGYGVLKAATGVAQHIGFAAAGDGATDNVKAHAQHVSTSAQNAVEWAKQIVVLGKEVQASTSAAGAAGKVSEIGKLVAQLVDGVDANGDGKVTWVKGEGGLGQSQLHMNFMSKGEGLTN